MPKLPFKKIGTLFRKGLRRFGRTLTPEEATKHLLEGKFIGIESKKGVKLGFRAPYKGVHYYEILTSGGGEKGLPYRKIMDWADPLFQEKRKFKVFDTEEDFIKWLNKRSLKSKIREKIRRSTF
jgi:hypothetical protein